MRRPKEVTLPQPPDPPEHLTDRSQALWRGIVGGRIRRFERVAMLQSALEALDRADEARGLIEEQGILRNGATLNPLVQVERNARAQFGRLWGQLGLNWETTLPPEFENKDIHPPCG